jgi:hypothetical protein
MPCIAELDLNASRFLTTNIDMENIYIGNIRARYLTA